MPFLVYKQLATNKTKSSMQAESRTLATTDYKFVNSTNTSFVSSVYDLVRVTASSTRDITKSIGDLVKALETFSVSTTITGTDTWAGITSKHRFKPSTIITGGKKLEVWWNNGASPYNNNKALELDYTGTSTGNSNGFIFVRFLSSVSATTLSKVYIKFDYNATTNLRTMVIILQDIGTNFTDNAHFFVVETNGVTSLDGAYTVKGYNANSTGTAAGARAFVFSAIGDANKSIMRAAFPLTVDNTSAVYTNNPSTGAIGLANIGQVWTNFILANNTTVTSLNNFGGACGSSFIMTTPFSGNPISFTNVTTVANLKTCLDAIITAQSTTNNVKDLYFITNIKNPAYFSVSATTVSLYGVESLSISDTNKPVFDTLETSSSFLNVTRTTANTKYAANLDAVNVAALNLSTGTSIPIGASATSLTNLNTQWGNGIPGTGTSSATAGTNAVNGSSDNTAPF